MDTYRRGIRWIGLDVQPNMEICKGVNAALIWPHHLSVVREDLPTFSRMQRVSTYRTTIFWNQCLRKAPQKDLCMSFGNSAAFALSLQSLPAAARCSLVLVGLIIVLLLLLYSSGAQSRDLHFPRHPLHLIFLSWKDSTWQREIYGSTVECQARAKGDMSTGGDYQR
jgi:hypothetical protein